MRKSLKDFFEGVTIKNTLFTIIWTIGILAWIYFGISFTETKAEADQVWEQHLQRNADSVQDKPSPDAPKTESLVNPEDEVSRQTEASSSSVEEIIYDVAKEKQFNDPGVLVRIAKAESGLRQCAKNPSSSATGIFQILDMHGLTVEERCNPRIATAWAIDHFNSGNPWNSSRSKWDNS